MSATACRAVGRAPGALVAAMLERVGRDPHAPPRGVPAIVIIAGVG
jgi:predicted membrane protein